MNWDDLRVFLAAARRGSHKAAAKELHVDPTTVGRRLDVLERALGARLFERTPEGLRLSRAGCRLQERAERIEAELHASERELGAAEAEVGGTLRVTASDGFLHYVLLPELAQLRREHPALQLELRSDTGRLDLSRREADVALRWGRPTEPSLVARRLVEAEFGLYASESYLERAGSPRNAAALAGHDFIGFEKALDGLPHVRWLERHVGPPRYVLRANTTVAQCQAATGGHGIVVLANTVAEREPRLKRLLPRLQGPRRELWFVTHRDLRSAPRIAAFQRFVLSLLA